MQLPRTLPTLPTESDAEPRKPPPTPRIAPRMQTSDPPPPPQSSTTFEGGIESTAPPTVERRWG